MPENSPNQNPQNQSKLIYLVATLAVAGAVGVGIYANKNKAADQQPDALATAVALAGSVQPLAGAEVSDLNPELSTALGLDSQELGVVITSVEPGSIADQNKFMKGDILVEVNSLGVSGVTDLAALMQEDRRSGWRISFKRGDKILTREIVE